MPNLKGERGVRGRTGAAGRRGPAGPAASRNQILAAVQNEFDQIQQQLRSQIERTGQMQGQLDVIHNLLKTALDKG